MARLSLCSDPLNWPGVPRGQKQRPFSNSNLTMPFIIHITSLCSWENARDGHRCYLCAQMRKASLGEVKQLAQQQTASTRWAWQSHLAVCPQSPPPHRLSKIVIIPRGSRCGKVWREQLDHIFQQQPTRFLVCFEASLSTLAPQKASSPLGVRFMMWFPASYHRRSALLPQGQEAPPLLESLPTPMFSMGHACVTLQWAGVLWVLYQCGLVWNWRSHPFHHVVHEPADAGDRKFNHKLLSLALTVTFKKRFCGLSSLRSRYKLGAITYIGFICLVALWDRWYHTCWADWRAWGSKRCNKVARFLSSMWQNEWVWEIL